MKINIIMGKTSSGKTTVLNEICRSHGYNKIVTTTTRPMRKGEMDGIDYHFISKLDFVRKSVDLDFAEWKFYNTFEDGEPSVWYYGTEKQYLIDNGFLIVDVEGAISFITSMGRENLNIFYLDVDDQTIIDRAISRGDDLLELDRRLKDDNAKFNKHDLDKINPYYIQSYNAQLAVENILDIINN